MTENHRKNWSTASVESCK